MDSREVIISVRDLVMAFRNERGEEVRILDGVTLDIYQGETLVVMGGSGCGKSTFLNCLIGELIPSRGRILYKTSDMTEPVDIVGLAEGPMNVVRKRFGILFQGGALFNSMSVSENVALPLKEHSYVDPSIIDIVVTLKLQQVHMLQHREKMPGQLSGGQKKRAALARATALDPEILFYDEPSAGLDPVTSAAIDYLMIDLSKKLGVTSIIVTHEMDSAFRIADRMVMLDKGRVLRIGTRDEFDEMRKRDPADLATNEDRLIRQFLNGDVRGPLTDEEGMSEFEKLITEG